MMRFYWGLAVGHTYAHSRKSLTSQGLAEEDDNYQSLSPNHPEEPNAGDEPEFSLDNLEDVIIPDDVEEDDDADYGDIDPDDFNDMYG